MPNAKLGKIAWAVETTYGTSPGSFSLSVPINSFNPTASNNIEIVDLIADNIEYKEGYPGDFTISGPLNMPAYVEELGYFLYYLFGSVSTTQPDATGAPNTYQHTFTFGNTQPSITIAVDAVSEQFELVGSVITSMALNWSRTPPYIQANMNVLSKTITTSTASLPAVTIPTIKAFGVHNTTIKVDGSAISAGIRSINLTIDRNPDTEDAKTLTSGRFIEQPVPQATNITGSIKLRFDNMDLWKEFWGSSSATSPQDTLDGISLEIITTGELIESTYYYTLDLTLYNVLLTNRSGGMLERPGPIDVSFDIQAIYDKTAAKSAQVVLTNKTTSYT